MARKHRARIYDRGLISPQSGETFRPFLNTAEAKNFSAEEFKDFQDQIGAFLGGLNDTFEGKYNSLTITGRQKIAEKWRPQIVDIGNRMLRGKPADIRSILDSPIVQMIDGEELGKFFRFALESAKIDAYLQKSVLEQGLVAHKVTFVKGIPDPKVLAEAKADSQIGSYLLHPDLYKTAYIDDKPVGVVRIDNSAKISKVGSIFIRNEYRGRGYASSIIKTAVTPNKELMAFVEPSNKSSQTLFKSLGFTVKETRKIQGDTYDIFVRSAFQKDNT